jgi:hypothetical protein
MARVRQDEGPDEATLESRARELEQGTRQSIRFPCESLSAALRFAREQGDAVTAERPTGVLSRSHVYGGSVPEGTRYETTVVLEDAVVQGEAYDDDAISTRLVLWAADPDRLLELEAIAREELDAAQAKSEQRG